MSPRASFRPPRAGVEEFRHLTLDRSFSRNVVTRMLVDHAEIGGWTLDRVRITPDGTRRVILKRKIIRARLTA